MSFSHGMPSNITLQNIAMWLFFRNQEKFLNCTISLFSVCGDEAERAICAAIVGKIMEKHPEILRFCSVKCFQSSGK